MSRPNAAASAAIWAEGRVLAVIAAYPHGASTLEIAQALELSPQAVDLAYRSALRWASIAAVLDAWRERTEAV